MARKRMIDPSIWLDDGMAELTPRQQVLYIGLFSNADDEGRLKGSTTAITLMLPVVYLRVPAAEVQADLDAVLAQMQGLKRYVVDGKTYLAFVHYERWQRIDKPQPSTLPPPPTDMPTDREPFDDHSTNDRGTVTPNRKEEKLREANGMRARACERHIQFGGTAAGFDRAVAAVPDIPDDALLAEIEGFISFWSVERKQPPKNKDRAWLNWLKQALEIRRRRTAQANGNAPPARPLPEYMTNTANVVAIRKEVADGF